MVVIGAVFFAATLTWWIVPLTLATYASLVFLATRDPLFRSRVLEGRERRPEIQPRSLRERNVSPERRVRWLPRGETRRKVEAALEVHRRTVFAIEESGDVARAVLDDAVPKLHHAAESLVDIAEKREKAAEAIRDLKTLNTPHAVSSSSAERHEESRSSDLEDLEEELRAADAEISDTFEKLSTLRARVARVSIESGGAAQGAAAKLNADLDELNLRLEALRSTMSPPELPDR
jgi:chromosome segregation ATPase